MKLLKSAQTIRAIALSAALLSFGTVHQAAFAAQSGQANAEYKQFLKDHYNVSLAASLTKGDFVNAVNSILKLQPKDQSNPFTDVQKSSPYYDAARALYENGIITEKQLQGELPLTELQATFIAVKAAGLKELAYTYPQDKIKTALAKLKLGAGQTGALTEQAAQELAAAVDTGLLAKERHADFKPEAAADERFTSDLLVKILDFQGHYKHYLGLTTDDDIFGKVLEAWKTEDLISAKELRAVFDKALRQNLVTGYNLKDTRYDANFDPKLSLTYGHSDITHAVQLIGLLRSEGIQAKVQLEPKTSAFIYLKEWGEPTQTDDYQVVQIENGNYIAYSKEYDIEFEFDNAEQKNKFQSVIFQYAKKNSEDAKGLIYASWWQPLYYSLTELPDYKQISNNKITKGHYYAQSFTLNDKSADLAAGINKIDSSLQVDSYKFWVDEPFYNYLLGGYK